MSKKIPPKRSYKEMKQYLEFLDKCNMSLYNYLLVLYKDIAICIGTFETCCDKFQKCNKRRNKSPTKQKIKYSAEKITCIKPVSANSP